MLERDRSMFTKVDSGSRETKRVHIGSVDMKISEDSNDSDDQGNIDMRVRYERDRSKTDGGVGDSEGLVSGRPLAKVGDEAVVLL